MTAPVKTRILVVDDEDRLRRVLEARLIAMGHEVILAVDGEDGLAKASRDNPDLVLLDVMMPKLDGFEVARRLKESPHTGHIPIVMVTALGDVQDRVRALDAGADDFLTKPVDPSELKARVQSLLKVKAFSDHMRHYREELEAEVARKTEDLTVALRKIETSTLDTIYRLARAAECKDEDTGAHVQRVGHYAAMMARRTGQATGFVDLLMYAAPMHDVGKIGIPDRILLKPGKLDADEWGIMKTHAEIGAALLGGSDSELLRMAESIALTHHEKWDGSGYPRGLKGMDIPLPGRLTAIADVFDALCSRRPYKEPFPVGRSLDIIRNGRTQQFDPELVDVFLSSQADIMAIRAQFADDAVSHLVSTNRLAVGGLGP